MQVIDPDFVRRIDLPGVGPCPRPVDIDQGVTGFADLVSLRVYAFPAGETIHGDAEEDELFVVSLRGRAHVAIDVDGAEVGRHPLGDAAGGRAAFLPPHASYRLTTATEADIAYARVRPRAGARAAPAGFAATDGRLSIPDHASGMGIALEPVAPGRTLALPAGVEGLVHVVRGEIAVAGTSLRAWQTAALAAGETATPVAHRPGEVLIVTARP